MSENSRSNRAAKDNLKKALATLDEVSAALEIPDETVTTATLFYRELLQNSSEDRMYGLSIRDASVACLYLACKADRVPRNAEEFVEASDTSHKTLLRLSKKFTSELDIEQEAFTDPSHYARRYCEELGFDDDLTERAEQILRYAANEGIAAGKSPQGQAGSAVYIAALEHDTPATQDEISDLADVSQVTIRNRYQEQAKVLRHREKPSDDAHDIVDWFDNTTDTSGAIIEQAHSILSNARDLGQLDGTPTELAMAAILTASEVLEKSVSVRLLKLVSGLSSEEIQAAQDDLPRYLN
jgi:transcription initiation factor TFIIB